MASLKALIAELNADRYSSRSHELMVEQNGHLETLAELANTRAEMMKERITANLTVIANETTAENQSVPVTHILDNISLTRAFNYSDYDKINEQVAQNLKSFIVAGDEHITAMASELISRSVRKLFDNEERQASTQQYFLAVENDNFIRLDLHAWKTMVNTCLKRSVEQIGAFVLVKSAVDKKRIDFNTLLFLLQRMISQTGDIALIMKITEKARAIYDRR